MHKNKQNKKDKKYNPNKFIWFLYRKLSKFVCKHKFNLIIDRQDFDNRNKEEGCIVLFNHNCNSDFWIQGAIFNKEIANIVVTKRFKYIKRHGSQRINNSRASCTKNIQVIGRNGKRRRRNLHLRIRKR